MRYPWSILLFVCLSANAQKYNTTLALKDQHGGIFRADTAKQIIYLVFTAHEFEDGAAIIVKALEKNRVQASFFFTGDFYRKNPRITLALKQQGHYLGAHSNRHLLYCDWTSRDSMLVSDDSLLTDLKDNYRELEKAGIKKNDARFFIPPYEWYNSHVVSLIQKEGLTVVNFTPGTSSNADYTTPAMKNYLSSREILTKLYKFEMTSPAGLNGFHLLIHLGTDPARIDKLYSSLDDLIANLKKMGYSFRKFE